MQTLRRACTLSTDRCLHGPRAELTHPPLSVAFLKKFLTIIKRRARCARSATPSISCAVTLHLHHIGQQVLSKHIRWLLLQ